MEVKKEVDQQKETQSKMKSEESMTLIKIHWIIKILNRI